MFYLAHVADQVGLNLTVGNPEARFSHVMAHMYMCVGSGCSLLLDICIFLMFEGPKED